jgi:Flp pilus assembly pilin Flp
VIAIKALARFKRMETDQAFAEYVVIGTFLSLLLACLLAACFRNPGLFLP